MIKSGAWLSLTGRLSLPGPFPSVTAVTGRLLGARRDHHEVCVFIPLLLQYLLQSCSRGRRGIVEDMCYERRRAEARVDESAHHALVNAGEREIV
jgi:hypothetical protein